MAVSDGVEQLQEREQLSRYKQLHASDFQSKMLLVFGPGRNLVSIIEWDRFMPTAFVDGPYSFVFFSSDRDEPPHIHVKRDRRIAKFWLDPVVLAKNRGFPGHELNTVSRLVVKHEPRLLEAWREHFTP